MNNYWKIKSMSPEDLSNLLFKFTDCSLCPATDLCGEYGYHCKEAIDEWLLQEVHNDN